MLDRPTNSAHCIPPPSVIHFKGCLKKAKTNSFRGYADSTHCLRRSAGCCRGSLSKALTSGFLSKEEFFFMCLVNPTPHIGGCSLPYLSKIHAIFLGVVQIEKGYNKDSNWAQDETLGEFECKSLEYPLAAIEYVLCR